MTYIVQGDDARPGYDSLSDLLSDGWPEDTQILELNGDGEAVNLAPLSHFRSRDALAESEPEINWQVKFEKAVSDSVVAASRHRVTRMRIEQERDVALMDKAMVERRLSAAEVKVRATQRKLDKADEELARLRDHNNRLLIENERLRKSEGERRAAIVEEIKQRFIGAMGGPLDMSPSNPYTDVTQASSPPRGST